MRLSSLSILPLIRAAFYILPDRNEDNLLKKFLVLIWLFYALKAEDKYLHKRAFTSHSRNGLTAFAVFLLSLFVKRQDKPASGVGCRSPPANLDFQKNSDWR